MEKAISASDANRKFSQLLREVKEGRTYVVTSHGRPVARIAPIESKEGKVGDSPAWAALMRRLRRQRVVNIGPWTRDELYDRD
ncbi:MAG: type II toxin-antitoxin system prevent-host-death family antitoxin [Terriglobales bacterium]|jgi:prevent-host-death family protein